MISRGVKNWPPSLPFFAHLQQQAFVDLRQREDVRVVDRLGRQAMHLVAHVAQVLLRVDPHPLDARQDFADDFLPGRRVGPVAQALQVGQQLAVDELQHLALGEHFFPALAVGRSPVLPAVGRFDRRREVGPDRFGILGFVGFAFVQNPQEQNPGQFRDVLHRPSEFERRMMSQIDLTAPLTDCCEFSRLPLPLADPFFFAAFFFAIVIRSKSSLECCAK